MLKRTTIARNDHFGSAFDQPPYVKHSKL